MALQRLFDVDLDRILRSNFSDGSMNYSSFYSYDYYFDFSYICEQSTGREWAVILSLISVFLGVFTSIIYLIVVMRRYTAFASNFRFLNNFLVASLINLLTSGVSDVMTFRSYCWYGGRLLCKVLPTILDNSENAMILFTVAIILEQNHPQIHLFFSKNTKLRKRTVALILWFVTIIFAIPEVIIWDIIIYSGDTFVCGLRHRHVFAFLSKGLVLEYLLPLLLLLVAVIHAAVVSSKRSNSSAANPTPEGNYSRSAKNEPQEDTPSQCPPIRVTSIAIGAVVFVTRTPHYVWFFLHAFFRVYSKLLVGLSIVLYPVPSIVAPVLVLFSSPIHKKLMKETYQSTMSCIAGRYVKEGFLLSEENEEKLEDTDKETESK